MKESWIERVGLTWLFLFILLGFLAWAYFFQIEQAVHAQGQVMPATRTQVIQAADGGVLETLLVKEGQSVKTGQVLAVLERERASAGVEEGAARVASLTATLARARAEAQDSTPQYPAILRNFKDAVAEQQALFLQKRSTLDAELSSLNDSLALAKDELQINEKLTLTGDISQLELMRAKRQVIEVQSKIKATRNKFLQDARQEAAKVQEELASQRFKLDERQSVLQHTELTSPVDGIVKALRVNTVGGVLRAGDELMQISPTDVDLIVEVKILPADIGQLYEGLPVSVKLDAFDNTIYGALVGRLEYISADTLSEQSPNGQLSTFYRAHIKLTSTQQNPKLRLSDLKPGMTAGVDIQTGSRSILSYLLKPLTKAFQGAASQR